MGRLSVLMRESDRGWGQLDGTFVGGHFFPIMFYGNCVCSQIDLILRKMGRIYLCILPSFLNLISVVRGETIKNNVWPDLRVLYQLNISLIGYFVSASIIIGNTFIYII